MQLHWERRTLTDKPAAIPLVETARTCEVLRNLSRLLRILNSSGSWVTTRTSVLANNQLVLRPLRRSHRHLRSGWNSGWTTQVSTVSDIRWITARSAFISMTPLRLCATQLACWSSTMKSHLLRRLATKSSLINSIHSRLITTLLSSKRRSLCSIISEVSSKVTSFQRRQAVSNSNMHSLLLSNRHSHPRCTESTQRLVRKRSSSWRSGWRRRTLFCSDSQIRSCRLTSQIARKSFSIALARRLPIETFTDNVLTTPSTRRITSMIMRWLNDFGTRRIFSVISSLRISQDNSNSSNNRLRQAIRTTSYSHSRVYTTSRWATSSTQLPHSSFTMQPHPSSSSNNNSISISSSNNSSSILRLQRSSFTTTRTTFRWWE